MGPDTCTVSCGKYPAEQSPSEVQSLPGVTAQNRGIGAVEDAVIVCESGASVTVSFAVVGVVFAGMPMKVGICALSRTFGLASTTSYTTYPAPPVKET